MKKKLITKRTQKLWKFGGRNSEDSNNDFSKLYSKDISFDSGRNEEKPATSPLYTLTCFENIGNTVIFKKLSDFHEIFKKHPLIHPKNLQFFESGNPVSEKLAILQISEILLKLGNRWSVHWTWEGKGKNQQPRNWTWQHRTKKPATRLLLKMVGTAWNFQETPFGTS